MKKKINNLLKNKNQIYRGVWNTINSEMFIDIIGKSGLDFIIIDNEHGFSNFTENYRILLACESNNISCAIRLPEISQSEILKASDLGFGCLHFPNVKNINDIKKIIDFTNYSPKGKKGFSPFSRAYKFDRQSLSYNKPLNCIHVENTEIIEKIDEILKFNEIDLFYFGLYDLSISMGIKGQVNNKKLKKVIEYASKKILKKNKTCGTIVNNVEEFKYYKKLGFKYFTYSVDSYITYSAFSEIFSKLK